MDFIPLEPNEELGEFLESIGKFPFSLVKINHAGDYKNENIVFIANEDIESLYDFMLVYSIEDTETGLPIYSQCRILTFDSLELPKGSYLKIFTCGGQDTTTITFDTASIQEVVYWNLPEPIWDKPHSSFELIKRGESYGGGSI